MLVIGYSKQSTFTFVPPFHKSPLLHAFLN